MPMPCPDCSAPLPEPPGPACPRCALPLRGPAAARLHGIDVQLAALTAERAQVLAVLRAARDGAPALAGSLGGSLPGSPAGSLAGPAGPVLQVPQQPVGAWGAVGGPPAAVPARVGRSPQAVLLGLGALLLLVATSVFLAVVWLLIGVVGQVAVMAGLVAGAGAGAVESARRGLGSTGTALAWLAAGLTVVAAQAGRALGLPGLAGAPLEAVVGGTALVGAGLAAVTARRSGQPVFAVQAVLSSGVAVPALLLAAEAEPALLVAGTGGWALIALLLAHAWPGLLHPATAPAAALAARGGAVAALLPALLGGLAVAALDLPAPALRTALAVAVLAAAVLEGARRGAPAALPLAAGVLGAAGLLAVRGAAEVAGGDPERAATVAGALAWLLAAALLLRRSSAPWGGAAAAGAALALAAALERQDAGAVALLSAALAVGAAVVARAGRDEPRRVGVAVPVAAASALAAVAAGLLHAGSGPLRLVVAVGVLGAAVALVAAWRQEEPEEPGLGAVAGAALVGALLAALRVEDPALTGAAVLAGGGVLALGYACLPRRGWVAPVGVVLSSAASWTLLADRGEDLLEVYTLPVALLLLVVGLVRAGRDPQAPSWTTTGPAAAMALVPSAQLAVLDPASARSVVVTAAAVAVVLLGVRARARALVLTGGLVTVELALVQLGEAAQHVPRWLVLAALGSLLLGAGATYEARVQQARAAGAWVRALR